MNQQARALHRHPQSIQARVESIDSLRGFSLLCILILHSVEHFNFTWPAEHNPRLIEPLDPYVHDVAKFLFSGKAYAIFSLMFGVSFAIQMERRRNSGQSIIGRYLWRLAILLMFGYVFSLVYIGEVLSLYALFGISLAWCGRLKNRWLLLLAVCLALQPPTLLCWLQSFRGGSVTGPGDMWERWAQAYSIFAHGTLADVVRFNAWQGHIAVWQWSNYAGRHLQMLSLFLVGVVVGRSGYFYDTRRQSRRTLVAFAASASATVLLLLVLKWVSVGGGAPPMVLGAKLLTSYLALAQAGVLASGYMLAFSHFADRRFFFGRLAHYGRMSLSNYVTQQLVGVWCYYGFGLGLYQYFGATLSAMYGVAFFVVHLHACELWLRHFRMGPLEWCWRRMTHFEFATGKAKRPLP